ncbi:MAG: hypothetical protein ACI30J_04690 [Paludibacteraceae bacterium]
MRKIVLFMLLAMGAAAFAEDEPSLIVSTDAGDSVVVVSSIQKIFYSDTQMHILCKDSTQMAFAVADIDEMRLESVPQPTGVPTVLSEQDGVRKVLVNGQVYIVRNGKWYSVRGINTLTTNQ